MNSKGSKSKGSRGENELVEYLKSWGYTDAHRNNQRYVGGRGNPDVDCTGLQAFHVEVKRTERLNLSAAMKQAQGDAVGRVPVVVSRKSREPWIISMRLGDFLALHQSDNVI